MSAKVRSSSTTSNALLGSTGRYACVTVTHLVGIEELLTGLVPSSQRHRLELQAVVEQILWDHRLDFLHNLCSMGMNRTVVRYRDIMILYIKTDNKKQYNSS